MMFRTSSYSLSGHCVDVGWRKSTYSVNTGACVEMAAGSGILVRDTTQAAVPDRVMLAFPARAWADFTGELKRGLAKISAANYS